MKVYVLETGVYEMAGIFGIFATPALAMAAWQPKRDESRHPTSSNGQPHSYEWTARGDGYWSFGADWSDAAEIHEYEVEGASHD